MTDFCRCWLQTFPPLSIFLLANYLLVLHFLQTWTLESLRSAHIRGSEQVAVTSGMKSSDPNKTFMTLSGNLNTQIPSQWCDPFSLDLSLHRSTMVRTILMPLLFTHDELSYCLRVEDRKIWKRQITRLCVCVCTCVFFEAFPFPVERCAPLRRELGPLQLLLPIHMRTLDSLTQCSFQPRLPHPSLPPSTIHWTPFSSCARFCCWWH